MPLCDVERRSARVRPSARASLSQSGGDYRMKNPVSWLPASLSQQSWQQGDWPALTTDVDELQYAIAQDGIKRITVPRLIR